MGAHNSSPAELAKNDALNRLVSKEVLTPSDPFWNSLLSYNFKLPQNKADWKAFEQSIEELQKRFLISNLKTGNFVSLLRVVLLRHTELKNSVLTENSLFIWQTFNALFIVRIVVKFMVERIKEEDVVKQFNVVLPDEEEETVSMFTRFLSCLVELVVETPTGEHTYALQLESTRLMVVMLSSVLYTPGKPPHQLSAWREMMTGQASVMVTPLTCGLLLRYMEQSKAPANMVGEEGGSLVLGLASGVWNILTLGYSSVNTAEVVDVDGGSNTPLADTSLTLLLLLVNHCTDTSAFTNPYREALFTFSNASGMVSVRLPSMTIYIQTSQTLDCLPSSGWNILCCTPPSPPRYIQTRPRCFSTYCSTATLASGTLCWQPLMWTNLSSPSCKHCTEPLSATTTISICPSSSFSSSQKMISLIRRCTGAFYVPSRYLGTLRGPLRSCHSEASLSLW